MGGVFFSPRSLHTHWRVNSLTKLALLQTVGLFQELPRKLMNSYNSFVVYTAAQFLEMLGIILLLAVRKRNGRHVWARPLPSYSCQSSLYSRWTCELTPSGQCFKLFHLRRKRSGSFNLATAIKILSEWSADEASYVSEELQFCTDEHIFLNCTEFEDILLSPVLFW